MQVPLFRTFVWKQSIPGLGITCIFLSCVLHFKTCKLVDRILKMVANVMADLKRRDESFEINKAVVASLESAITIHDIKKKLLPTSYFNLSNAYDEANLYPEALATAQKGIAFCQNYGEYKTFGELHYNVGKAYYFMSNSEQAKLYFQQAHTILISQGKFDIAGFVKKKVREKYKITVE